MNCVVVGSGAAGMSTALLLAQQGHKVTLVEKSPHVAPLLAGFTRAGLHFDTGFHYAGGLHEGGFFRAWLKVLGIESALEFLPLDPHRTEIFRFTQGDSYFLPTGYAAVAKAIEQQFPHHTSQWAAFWADITRVLDSSPYTNIAHRADGPLLHPGTGKSVADVLRPLGLPTALESMLAVRCLLYGVPAHEAAWDDFAMVAGPYFSSSHSIAGGGKALVRAFVRALDAAGVSVCTGTEVTQVAVDAQRRVSHVGLEDGTSLPCDRCFFTGHPAQLQSLLPKGALRPAFFSRLRETEESFPALMLFAESSSDFLDNRVCYLLGEAGLDALFADARTSSTPSVYLSASPPDARGRRAVTVISPLSEACPQTWNSQPRPAAYTDWKQQMSHKLVTHVQQHCPELRGNLRLVDAATDLSMRRWVHGSTGSMYGVRHSVHYPPFLPITRIQGLFLAGQNILLPGVLGAIISAALAVGFATDHKTILEVFRQCAHNEL